MTPAAEAVRNERLDQFIRGDHGDVPCDDEKIAVAAIHASGAVELIHALLDQQAMPDDKLNPKVHAFLEQYGGGK